jgi:succinyl-diaminopimelate desuccinylase
VFSIDIRSVPASRHADVQAQLERELGADVELETLLDLEPVYTSEADAWVQEVFDIVQPYLGTRPQARVATYFTDAAALSRAYGGPPIVILGPGEAQMAHQTDEYCVMDRIEAAVALYEDVARRWCGR